MKQYDGLNIPSPFPTSLGRYSHLFSGSEGLVSVLFKEKNNFHPYKKKQTIYYFSREKGTNAVDLPSGYEAMEVQKTGLPVLKKK